MPNYTPRLTQDELKKEMKKVVSDMQSTLSEMNGYFDTFYDKVPPQNRMHLFEVFKKNQVNIDNMKQMFVGDFFKFLSEQDKKQDRGTR